MEYKLPKILPEDVFTGPDTEPRLTGEKPIDIFAHIVHTHRHIEPHYAATLMGLDKSTLRGLVIAYSGLSPAEWRNRYLAQIVKHLLKHTRMPYAEISRQVGLGTTPSILTGFCQRTLGCNPSQIRRGW